MKVTFNVPSHNTHPGKPMKKLIYILSKEQYTEEPNREANFWSLRQKKTGKKKPPQQLQLLFFTAFLKQTFQRQKPNLIIS